MKLVFFTIFATLLASCFCLQLFPHPGSNINDWKTEPLNDINGNGYWRGRDRPFSSWTTQYANGIQPTFIISPFLSVWATYSFNVMVDMQAEKLSRDYIGFVLGYNPGDYNNNAAKYLLVSWKGGEKRENQHFGCGGVASPGLSISWVKGTPSAASFWTLSTISGSCGRETGEWGSINKTWVAKTLNNTAWVPGQTYHFTVTTTDTSLTIWVNDVIQFEITNTPLPWGHFGFYSQSQPHVTFSDFTLSQYSVYSHSSIYFSIGFRDEFPFSGCTNFQACYGLLILLRDHATNSTTEKKPIFQTEYIWSNDNTTLESEFFALHDLNTSAPGNYTVSFAVATTGPNAWLNFPLTVYPKPPHIIAPSYALLDADNVLTLTFSVQAGHFTPIQVTITYSDGFNESRTLTATGVISISHDFSGTPGPQLVWITATATTSHHFVVIVFAERPWLLPIIDPFNCPKGCGMGSCERYDPKNRSSTPQPGGCSCSSGVSGRECVEDVMQDKKKQIAICTRNPLSFTSSTETTRVLPSETSFMNGIVNLVVRTHIVVRERQFSLMKFLPAIAANNESFCNYPGPPPPLNFWAKGVDLVRCHDTWTLTAPWTFLRDSNCFEGPVQIGDHLVYSAALFAMHSDFLGNFFGLNVTRRTEYLFYIQIKFPIRLRVSVNILAGDFQPGTQTPNTPSVPMAVNITGGSIPLPQVNLTPSPGTIPNIDSAIVLLDFVTDVNALDILQLTLSVRTRTEGPFVLSNVVGASPFVPFAVQGTGININCTAGLACEQEWTVTFPVNLDDSCDVTGVYEFGWNVTCNPAPCPGVPRTFTVLTYTVSAATFCPEINITANYQLSVMAYNADPLGLATDTTTATPQTAFTGIPLQILFEITVNTSDPATLNDIQTVTVNHVSLSTGGLVGVSETNDEFHLVLRNGGLNLLPFLSDPAAEPTIKTATDARTRFVLTVNSDLLINRVPNGPDLRPVGGFVQFTVNARVDVQFTGAKKSIEMSFQGSSVSAQASSPLVIEVKSIPDSSAYSIISFSWTVVILTILALFF